jgi:iron complex outermembrane receptor protein
LRSPRDGYLHRIPYPGASNYAFDPITSLKAAGYGNQGYGTEGGDNTWNLRGKLRYTVGFRATLTGDYSKTDTSQIANKVITTFPSVFAGTYNCAIAGNPTVTVGGVTARATASSAARPRSPIAARSQHPVRSARDLWRQCRQQPGQQPAAL